MKEIILKCVGTFDRRSDAGIPWTAFNACGVAVVIHHGEEGPPMEFEGGREYKMTLELVEKEGEKVEFAKHFDRSYRCTE